jgi:hypothetical protein
VLAKIRATSVLRQEELFAPLSKQERETFFDLARKIATGSGSGLLHTTTMKPATHVTQES